MNPSKFKFYGQHNPPVDKVLFTRYFPKAVGSKHVAIECGAFTGIHSSCCYFFERFRGWKCINIEPVPVLFQKVVKNRPASINVRKALSNSTGEIKEFTHMVHPKHGELFGNGSLTHVASHIKELKQKKCSSYTVPVETITYKDFVKEQGLTELDLFILDVEGHELQVIEGMKGAHVFPKVFVIEFPHIGLENLKKNVAPFGYKLDHISFNNAFFIL